MNKELNVFTLRVLREQYEAEHMDTEVEALDEAIKALDISGTNGVFIPGITVEEFRSATFMGVKMLLANGCIYDVSFPLAQPDIARDIATIIENEKDMRVIMREAEQEIIRCKDCKHRRALSIDVFPEITVYVCNYMYAPMNESSFCSHGERREDGI